MAKKSFSGGLNSLLGKAEKLKNSGTKEQKKKLQRLLKLEQRERNKSNVYSE
jgi:hypothetical protein